MKSAYLTFFLSVVGLTTVPAQTFTSLLSFDGSNGSFPQGSLVEGEDGNLYGTTPYSNSGFGTVFVVTPTGELTTLYNFCTPSNCIAGGAPYAGLIRARNGNFYGATAGSGYAPAYGTVFEITPNGELTTLYIFCSRPNCIDGARPFSGLVEARNGNFYGMTYRGGTHNAGTIFEITPEGKLTTLHSFCSEVNCGDGEAPLLNTLVQGRNGNFYGTTPTGGAYGFGIVFEITRTGKLTTLHSFDGTDGQTPLAGLLQGRNGHFYGTTADHGGTIFEITPKGKLTTLYSFCSQPNCSDGGVPNGALVQGRNGNFYGTTYAGGVHRRGGTVFEVTPKGKLTTLYSFCAESGCVDGWAPVSGLTEDANGDFYGTTYGGGDYDSSACGIYGEYGCGTLFRLAPQPADQ